jgi:hypothetical protein
MIRRTIHIQFVHLAHHRLTDIQLEVHDDHIAVLRTERGQCVCNQRNRGGNCGIVGFLRETLSSARVICNYTDENKHTGKVETISASTPFDATVVAKFEQKLAPGVSTENAVIICHQFRLRKSKHRLKCIPEHITPTEYNL